LYAKITKFKKITGFLLLNPQPEDWGYMNTRLLSFQLYIELRVDYLKQLIQIF